ncbi:MAG: hypothetical protein WD646_10655 [Actinomycetota bacterium]
MRKHVRDRLSLGAAVAAAAVLVGAALVVTTNDNKVDERGSDLTLPSPTSSASPSPAPKLLGSPVPLEPGPPTKPKAGTYRYRLTPPDVENPDRTTEVRIVDNGSTGQTEILDGQLAKNVVWRDDGKYILQHTFGQPQGAACDWEPDIRELAFPLREGRWVTKTSCRPFEGGVIEHSAVSQIMGAAQVIIGGQDVVVWVIRSESTELYKNSQDVVEQKQVSRSHFSPKLGLTVRLFQRRTGEDLQSRKEFDQAVTLELVSLNPS